MPDVQANRRQWDGDYAWPEGGDEWSAAWGTADAQWHLTLAPRLRSFLPAATILEIAPGYGRWTQFLLGQCDDYIGVDLSERCVVACRDRFGTAPHADFRVGDGVSLPGVADASIDLAFSFDALVHAEDDVIGAYLLELRRTLVADGVAFLHHSNLAACPPVPRPLASILRVAGRVLRRGPLDLDLWRAASMSAERFRELAATAGLACIGQEIVNWHGGRLLDCISVVTQPESRWRRPNRVARNPYFMLEAASTAFAGYVHGFDPTGRAGIRAQPPAVPHAASATVGPWGVSAFGPRLTRGRREAPQ